MPIRIFLADDHAVMRDGLRPLLDANADMCVVMLSMYSTDEHIARAPGRRDWLCVERIDRY
jgi:DNA-binding NarL/FixJ family response regulator